MKTTLLHTGQVYVPIQDNDGARAGIAIGHCRALAADICGGFTYWRATGGWRKPDGELQMEQVYVLEVSHASENRVNDALTACANYLLGEFGQYAVYLKRAGEQAIILERE